MEKRKLHRRKLGRTELDFSEVTLGLWGLSGAYGPVTDSVFGQTIDAALEEGVNAFDVAPLWGNGEAERKLGEHLKGRRDEVRLITRAGVQVEDGQVVNHYDVDSLEDDCEQSLERLGTDWVDLWMIHDPPEEVMLDAKTYDLAQRLQAEGMIRAFGVSTSRVDVARAAISSGVDAVCMPVHLLHADDLRSLHDDLAQSGCGVLARSPLCHGLLAGRWTEYRRFSGDDHRAARWTASALSARVRAVGQLRYMVRGDVKNLASAALRFVLAQKYVASAVLGARRPAQVIGAASWVGDAPYLPQEDIDRIPQMLAGV